MPLTDRRQRKLIKKADLPATAELVLLGELAGADDAIRDMATNPLFLGLLCEYVERRREFPSSSHVVFEEYVDHRLKRDAGYLGTKFGTTPTAVRLGAEALAFCMGADREIGLIASRRSLDAAMEEMGLPAGGFLSAILNSLEHTKLGKPEEPVSHGESPRFTFAHRRFQEYFATCFVLKKPELLSEHQLLTDGRWRETAVTILQTQGPDAVRSLIVEAEGLLDEGLNEVAQLAPQVAHGDGIKFGSSASLDPFPWPSGILHILGILSSGLSPGNESLPPETREKVGRLLSGAGARGQVYDRKWAIDAAGASAVDVSLWLIRQAFESGSPWLRSAAYLQLRRLPSIPPDIEDDIRQTLVAGSAGGRIRKQRLAVNAQLRRLARPEAFLRIERLLIAIPFVDLLLHASVLAATAAGANRRTSPTPSGLTAVAVALMFSYAALFVLRGGPPFLRRGAFPALSIEPGASLLLSWLRFPMVNVYVWLFTRIVTIEALLLVLPAYKHLVSGLAVLALYLYVGIWSAGALSAARIGRLTSPFLWAGAPIALPWMFAQLVRKWFREIPLRDLLVTAALAAALGALVGSGFWLVQVLVRRALHHLSQAVRAEAAGAIGVVLGLVGAVSLIALGWSFLTDLRWAKRWLPAGAVVSGREMVEAIKRLETHRGRRRFVTRIASEGLRVSPEALRVLLGIVAARDKIRSVQGPNGSLVFIAVRRGRRAAALAREAGVAAIWQGVPDLYGWLESGGWKRVSIIVTRIEPDVIDTISRLLEGVIGEGGRGGQPDG